MKEYTRFKIKKPHTTYIDELIQNDVAHIKQDKIAGLYLSKKIKHDCKDMIGIKTESHNNWILYKKQPIKKKLTGSKYEWFGL